MPAGPDFFYAIADVLPYAPFARNATPDQAVGYFRNPAGCPVFGQRPPPFKAWIPDQVSFMFNQGGKTSRSFSTTLGKKRA